MRSPFQNRARRCGLDGAGVAAGVSSAAWPVSARNTSSSVGRRSARSSSCTPAASRSRTTSASSREPLVTGTTDAALLGVHSRAPPRHAGCSARTAVEVAPARERHFEALAAHLSLQLVGRAARRSRAPGPPRRSGRRAGRPLRGTASSAARSCRRRRGPQITSHMPSGCVGRGRWSARRGRAPAARRSGSPPGRVGGACHPNRS